MVDASRIPVIVGVGDLRWNPADGHREPLDLIHDATVGALNDSGHAELGTQIDSVFAIKTVSWSYDDLPGPACLTIRRDPHGHLYLADRWPLARGTPRSDRRGHRSR